jgi:multicomponent Na+:H+ antiporter subunit C
MTGAWPEAASPALIYGLCGAAVVGLGLYGFIARRHLLRRVLAFNVIGSGIFLLFGGTAFRRPDLDADPVPQALIITGIVVALSLTALVVALAVRYAQLSNSATLPEEDAEEDPARASE